MDAFLLHTSSDINCIIICSISDPVPEYPPEIDLSKKSKFTLHHADGTTIPSHPKV